MQPKTINILYWVFTILFAALMIFSAYSSILVNEDAKKLIHEQLATRYILFHSQGILN